MGPGAAAGGARRGWRAAAGRAELGVARRLERRLSDGLGNDLNGASFRQRRAARGSAGVRGPARGARREERGGVLGLHRRMVLIAFVASWTELRRWGAGGR